MSKKWIVAIVIILLIGAGVFYFNKPQADTSAKPTIKIGVSLPLTGNLAFLGESYKNGILLALDGLKDTKYNYEFVFEDDQFGSALAATAANKLINVDKVDMIASFGSPAGNAISPIADGAKVVHFAVASDPAVAKGAYNFSHWTPPYEESKLMLSELKKRGLKRVVLFEQNQPGVLAVADALRKDFANSGVSIVSTQKFGGEEKDFRSYIAKAKAVPADVYLLAVTSPALEVLTKQIKEAGVKLPLTSVESFEFTEQPNLFEGYWYVNGSDHTSEFIKSYTDKYQKAPILSAGNGYDIVNLFVSAVESKGDGVSKPTTSEIGDSLSSVKDYRGAMGTLSIDPDGLVISPASVRMIKDGKPVSI